MKLHASISLCLIMTSFAFTMAHVANEIHSKNALKKESGSKPYVRPEPLPSLSSYKRQRREMQMPPQMMQFQKMLGSIKNACMKESALKAKSDQPLLYKLHPTKKEKCVIECILKRTGIMNNNNRLSRANIANLAESMSHNNELVVSIALAMADNCNRRVTASDKCEAAFQISQCIAHEMKAHNFELLF